MNEEEERMQKAQEYFDAMEQGKRETLEEEMRSYFEHAAHKLEWDPEDPEAREGKTIEQLVREMCITHLAHMMVRAEVWAEAWAGEFVTEELIERYMEEEFERLVKLPEYAPEKMVPEDVLGAAVLARLISGFPEAARYPSAPE